MDFGRVWGGFGEAKCLDFYTFFIICSMQNLECKLEGQKIGKKWPKTIFDPILGSLLRSVRAWGEGFRMGGSLPKSEFQALP